MSGQHAHTEDELSPSIVLLECGKTLAFRIAPPKTGEHVWCYPHQHYVKVKSGRAEFRARCNDCRMSRATGASRLNAELVAIRHLKRFPTHRVALVQGAKTLHTYEHQGTQLALDTDVPPF